MTCQLLNFRLFIKYNFKNYYFLKIVNPRHRTEPNRNVRVATICDLLSVYVSSHNV